MKVVAPRPVHTNPAKLSALALLSYHHGMHTLVCVPIMVQDEPAALADAALARDCGADIVEFRIDEFFSGQTDAGGQIDQREIAAILRMVQHSPLPCIVTCRAASEGGHYDADDSARVSLYQHLGTSNHPPQYLDIEFAAYSRSANLKQKVNLAIDHPHQRRDVRTGLILSSHDFAGRPRELLRRISAMQDEPAARLVKIAYAARSIRDNLELFDILSEHSGTGAGRPMIALAMGPFGLMSRVLAPKFGAFLTFASLKPQSTTAPGQPTLRDLLHIYNFRSISRRTRVLGVVGWPVEHSLSPLIHNAGFEALAPDTWERANADNAVAHDAVYLPLPVPPEYEHFKATLSALIDHPQLDFAGCSVTLPHKQHLVRLARERMNPGEHETWEVDALSDLSGSANTLVVDRDPRGSVLRCRVFNTDALAAASVLQQTLGSPASPRRIAIIGAGGVARAVAAGLLAHHHELVVFNRTPSSAERLVADITTRTPNARLSHAPFDALANSPFDALVNCTPVGMRSGPAPNDSPIDMNAFAAASPSAVVFDTVYTPLITPLLEHASLAGLRTIDGLEMFIRQAGHQFTLWTNHPPPLSLFRRVATEALTEN